MSPNLTYVLNLLRIARRSLMPVTQFHAAGYAFHTFVTLPTHVAHFVVVGGVVEQYERLARS